MATARVYLVRHGETEENKRNIIQGQMDTLLNETGEEQGRQIAGALQEVPFDMAFSSDLSRATRTAEAILAYHRNVRLKKQEELRERYLGNLQGKDIKHIKPLDLSVEPTGAFANRTVQWWNKAILQRLSSLPSSTATPHHILVTTHHGFIRTLVRSLIGSRKATCAENVVVGECDNSSVTIIEVGADRKGIVVQYGDVSHLVADQSKLEGSNLDKEKL